MARLGMESGRERRQRRGNCMLRWSVKEREERELHAGMVSEGVRPWSVIRT